MITIEDVQIFRGTKQQALDALEPFVDTLQDWDLQWYDEKIQSVNDIPEGQRDLLLLCLRIVVSEFNIKLASQVIEERNNGNFK